MTAKKLLNKVDSISSDIHLRLFGERPGVSIFLFHSIFEDEASINKKLLYPQERMTISKFRQFVEYFLSINYQFLTPSALLDTPLDPKVNYGLLSFDDGYYNNTYILDILQEYAVPALFFVSTSYVVAQKKFWADIIYKERSRRGATEDQILAEVISLKKERIDTIYQMIRDEFGDKSTLPVGDADRPLTMGELKEFALHPMVHIGNHTHKHEVLTNLRRDEIAQEIGQCQTILEETIGYRPDWISYPNGSHNRDVLDVCVEAGFRAGISTIQKKNDTAKLGAKRNDRLLLNRFNPVVVEGTIDYQALRSSFQLKTLLKQWLQ